MKTAEVLMPDGFLRTGDIAVVDEKGFVRIVDRKRDVIVVSGFNVYPNEIEEVVAMHAGVLEVGAIGVPDHASGAAVKIVVVKKVARLTEKELIAHCRLHLVGYKIPRQVEFRHELPKNQCRKNFAPRLARNLPAKDQGHRLGMAGSGPRPKDRFLTMKRYELWRKMGDDVRKAA